MITFIKQIISQAIASHLGLLKTPIKENIKANNHKTCHIAGIQDINKFISARTNHAVPSQLDSWTTFCITTFWYGSGEILSVIWGFSVVLFCIF